MEGEESRRTVAGGDGTVQRRGHEVPDERSTSERNETGADLCRSSREHRMIATDLQRSSASECTRDEGRPDLGHPLRLAAGIAFRSVVVAVRASRRGGRHEEDPSPGSSPVGASARSASNGASAGRGGVRPVGSEPVVQADASPVVRDLLGSYAGVARAVVGVDVLTPDRHVAGRPILETATDGPVDADVVVGRGVGDQSALPTSDRDDDAEDRWGGGKVAASGLE